MTVVAGIDVGNATTEVVLLADGASPGPLITAAGRAPTRGRKGSPESLNGAVALMRRLERQAGVAVTEARIAPLRPVDTFVHAVPDVPPSTGRLRVLAAGVATPGGAGSCVGVPVTLGSPARGSAAGPARPVIVLVPAGVRYDEAAARIRALLAAGTRVGAVLVASDEGVLVANRLPAAGGLPVIDQVDIPAAAACALLAVEVRPPGHPLTLAGDPVALGAALGLGTREAADVARATRGLLDYSNAVVGLAGGGGSAYVGAAYGPAGGAVGDTVSGPVDAGGAAPGPDIPGEPWVLVDGQRVALRAAARRAAHWAPGAVRALGIADVITELDDMLAVDLAMVAESATARRGSVGRAILVAALNARSATDRSALSALSCLLPIPVTSPVTEPAAARLGAATTPGMAPGALVADIGSGTIDVITASGAAVVAGAGDLLTVAVARALGVPRAAADWIKRGPCIRVDGAARYEAEDGTRGFLDVPAPASAAGMLAVPGPGGLLTFGPGSGGYLGPAEWRAIRLRLKQAVIAVSLRRALDAAGWAAGTAAQLVLVGGPAGDDELVGVLARALPETVVIGRGNVGGSLGGQHLGHRYAAALGLALAPGES